MLAQYKTDYMLVNRNPNRFLDLNDVSDNFASRTLPNNQKCEYLDGDTLLLIDNFSKQATFQFSYFYSTDEDTVTFGYSEGFTKKEGIVLAKFNQNFTYRHYGKISSNGHTALIDYTINPKRKNISLVLASQGDTLFYNPRNKSDYLLTPYSKGNGASFIVTLDYQFNAISASPFTFAAFDRNTTISWIDDAYYILNTLVSSRDSISLHNDTKLAGNNLEVNLKLNNDGQLIWHSSSSFISDDKIVDFPHKVVINLVGSIYHNNFRYVFNADTLLKLDNTNIPIDQTISYIVNLNPDGTLTQTTDSIIHVPFSGEDRLSSDFISGNFVELTGPYGDSLSIFRGKEYTFPKNDLSTRAVRLTDNTLIENEVFPVKRGDFYFHLSSVNRTSANNSDFAYHESESLKVIHKPSYGAGHLSCVLSKYDKNLDLIWSRSIRYSALFTGSSPRYLGGLSVADNGELTALYGVGFEQNGIHPESGSNNFDGGFQYQLLILDCRPISYFRVKERQHRTYTFENLSHQKTNYTWNFGDGTSSTEKNPKHTFPDAVEVYDVQLITSDECGSDTFSREIYVNTVAVNTVKEDDIILYPNPANHTVSVVGLLDEEYTLTAYDAIGKELDLKHTNMTIDVGHLNKGVYILVFHTSTGNYVKKIIKD
jgi:hypothetical protein